MSSAFHAEMPPKMNEYQEQKMQKLHETVLYYHTNEAGSEKRVRQLKSVMVRMGVRIKNIDPEQVFESVGYLAGMPGYQSRKEEGEARPSQEAGQSLESVKFPVIGQDVLVLRNFTSGRMDFLFYNLKKAGVPKIDLKAVITPQNAGWTFYQLYQELEKEHAAVQKITD